MVRVEHRVREEGAGAHQLGRQAQLDALLERRRSRAASGPAAKTPHSVGESARVVVSSKLTDTVVALGAAQVHAGRDGAREHGVGLRAGDDRRACRTRAR